MITAEQAQQITYTEGGRHLLELIEKEVIDTAKIGRAGTTLTYGYLPKGVIEELVKCGYTLTPSKEGYNYKLEWIRI